MKYLTMRDEYESATSKTLCDSTWNEHETLAEAIADADAIWSYLTDADKKKNHIFVLESINPDEDADNHCDGNVIYTRKITSKLCCSTHHNEMDIAIRIAEHPDFSEFFRYKLSMDCYYADASIEENAAFDVEGIEDELNASDIELTDDIKEQLLEEISFFYRARV